jgi:phosphoribosylcarboxyaminoimidazole (NCAIR) mutase
VEEYASTEVGVVLPAAPKKKVTVVLGSESDIPTVAEFLKRGPYGNIGALSVNVISCHRNPDALRRFAMTGCGGADAVLAAGGKAFALPGVLDALLASNGFEIPVVGVALGKEVSTSLQAAILSIQELPGEPVVMDDLEAAPFYGPGGFERALDQIARGELPPLAPRTGKPPIFNIDLSRY